MTQRRALKKQSEELSGIHDKHARDTGAHLATIVFNDGAFVLHYFEVPTP